MARLKAMEKSRMQTLRGITRNLEKKTFIFFDWNNIGGITKTVFENQ